MIFESSVSNSPEPNHVCVCKFSVSGTMAPAQGCRSRQLLCLSVLEVPAVAGQEGRWLSKSISFWISGLERARPGIISPPLQLALPHDPLFRSSGDTERSLRCLET